MAIEDLHWIDKSSEDTLKALLDGIAGERIFLIFTYRPEYVHTWGSKSYHSQITLNRLSNRESLTVVNDLLGNENIESDLEELILEKTEGVPFFIEEFIKSLKDLKAIERHNSQYQLAENVEDLSIPSTIQDVIMARVDSLPESAKELLQVGSVIEREFSYGLIKEVSGLTERKILSRLSALKDSELIFERGIFPENMYIFKHALTQEVVYDSILTQRKKELHNKIGQAIEQLYKDNVHECYGILAEHFISSENFKKGAEYCRLAGKKAEKAGSLNDSTKYGEKQIACLERSPKTEQVEKSLIDARTTLGLYYSQLNHMVKAKASVDPIIELSKQKNYKKRISHIYIIVGQYYGVIDEDIPKAVEYLNEALKIGEELTDFVSLVLANADMALVRWMNCEFAKALQHYGKSLKINTAANSLWGIATIKSMITAYVYNNQGMADLAYETSTEALHIADKSGDIHSKAWANLAHGLSYLRKGDLKKAEEHLIQSAHLSERINLSPCIEGAPYYLGEIYFYMEDYIKSKMYFEKAISLFRKLNWFPSAIISSKIYLSMVEVISNEKNINLNDLFNSLAVNKIRIFEGGMLNCIGRILLNIDDQHIFEAEDWIKRAIETNEKNGMMWHLAQDYALYADLFKRKGDFPKAQENFIKAIKIFKECGADGWVEKYEKELETYL
jgi:predicted ATPase